MISRGLVGGGESASARKAHVRRSRHIDEKSVYMTGRVAKQARKDDAPITFIEEDSSQLQHPHDALVITVMITGYRTQGVLIDNGSFTDILYLSTFRQMRIVEDRLQLVGAPLVNFIGDRLFPLRLITLPMTVGLGSMQVTKEVNFLVVNYPSAYNAIIRCPSLNQLKAVTSVYHLMMRFPTDHGIGEVKSN